MESVTNTSAAEPKEVASGQQVQAGQVTGKSSREEGKSKRSQERETPGNWNRPRKGVVAQESGTYVTAQPKDTEKKKKNKRRQRQCEVCHLMWWWMREKSELRSF